MAGPTFGLDRAARRHEIRVEGALSAEAAVALGLLYESGLIWYATTVLDPIVRGWLGLLVALAVIQLGAGAAGLGSIMSPAQLFVYAIVTSVSVPCVATLAALRGEFGWRPALTMCGATLGIALADRGDPGPTVGDGLRVTTRRAVAQERY